MRYPFAPLEEIAHRTTGAMEGPHSPGGLISALSVRQRTNYYYHRGNGSVSALIADRMAVMFGYHPVDIWPEWIDDAYSEAICAYCSEPVSFEKIAGVPGFCDQYHHMKFLTVERRFDRERLSEWWERVNGVTNRVSVMTDDELSAFLGTDDEALAVAA